MKQRSDKRILTTHVGSLVRPPELKALAQSGQDRPVDAAPTGQFIETLKRATADVVKQQAAIGLDIISDGEFEQIQLVQLRSESRHWIRNPAQSVASGRVARPRSGPFRAT